MELNADLGERILEAFPNMSVDVHHPEITLNVEIREKIYIYSKIIPDLVVCRSEQTEKLCFCYPVELTARLQAT